MADMQRAGADARLTHGLLQPIADAVKTPLEGRHRSRKRRQRDFLARRSSCEGGIWAMSALAIGPGFKLPDLKVGLLFSLGNRSAGEFS